MADTIINTPPQSSQDNSEGWAVAVIILVVVIVAGVIWYRYYRASAGTTNINVTVPAPVTTDQTNQ
ncbi:MAG: hypothetical protein V4474_03410 [Patescibacteria group bacterium]